LFVWKEGIGVVGLFVGLIVVVVVVVVVAVADGFCLRVVMVELYIHMAEVDI
jgi:hypothetical protein